MELSSNPWHFGDCFIWIIFVFSEYFLFVLLGCAHPPNSEFDNEQWWWWWWSRFFFFICFLSLARESRECVGCLCTKCIYIYNVARHEHDYCHVWCMFDALDFWGMFGLRNLMDCKLSPTGKGGGKVL